LTDQSPTPGIIGDNSNKGVSTVLYEFQTIEQIKTQ